MPLIPRRDISAGMTTRSATAAVASSDDKVEAAELDAYRRQLSVKEKQLAEQAEAQCQHAKARERDLDILERSLREREDALSQHSDDRCPSVRDASAAGSPRHHSDMFAPTANPDEDKSRTQGTSRVPRTLHTHYAPYEDSFLPRFSLRDALETVPIYDARNMSLGQFIGACRRARDVVPPESEPSLTSLLVNKLRGAAYAVVADQPCHSITKLIELLSNAFGTAKSATQCRSELCTIFQRPGESTLDYVFRAKILRMDCLEAERRLNSRVPSHIEQEINELTAESFCNGLAPMLRIQLREKHYRQPFDAFARAIALANQAKLDRQRHGRSSPYRDPYGPYASVGYTAPSRPEELYGEGRYSRHDRTSRTPPRSSGYGNSYAAAVSAPPTCPRDRAAPQPASQPWCRYCRTPGHLLEECRKRRLNNGQTGNGAGPSGEASAPRHVPVRAARLITVAENEKEEEDEEMSQMEYESAT